MNTDDFAIRINQISKKYYLWSSPYQRLLHPIKLFFSIFMAKFRPGFHITKTAYQEFYALSDINFDIRKGESIGFIGINGSGKSTLLKIISGNLRPSSGSVTVDGRVVILDYNNGFNGEFSGKENIYIKASLLGLSKKQINEHYQSIVEFAELGEFIDQPVKTYSSGMVSRLGFAIIAHVNADIIITDEALAVGDIFFVQKCMKFIREFLKRGTFLFVSHATNDVLSLCQKAVWLEHGTIKALGPAPDVVQAYLDQTHLNSVKKLKSNEDNTIVPAAETAETLQREVFISQPRLSKMMDYQLPKYWHDACWDMINYSCLRNEIEIILNNEVGNVLMGGAKILRALIKNKNNETLKSILGGEVVTLTIEILAEEELKSPIVGFQVTNKFGQVIFADNSYSVTHNQPVLVKAHTIFSAEFTYQMPALPVGDYGVRLAIAVGEEDNAVLLHIIDHALIFRCVSSYVKSGLAGLLVPVCEIN